MQDRNMTFGSQLIDDLVKYIVGGGAAAGSAYKMWRLYRAFRKTPTEEVKDAVHVSLETLLKPWIEKTDRLEMRFIESNLAHRNCERQLEGIQQEIRELKGEASARSAAS
jgi:hypothetical protein